MLVHDKDGKDDLDGKYGEDDDEDDDDGDDSKFICTSGLRWGARFC